MKIVLKTTKSMVIAILLIATISCKNAAKKAEMAIVEPKKEMNNNKKNKIAMKKTGAFLEITLKVDEKNRPSAAEVYMKYKEPFLNQINGAVSKELILRNDDVQVLHGFESEAQANAYLGTELFSKDVVGELGPLLAAEPEVRIYTTVAPADKHPLSTGAFLQITLKVDKENRPAAGGVYMKYKKPFLDQIDGAVSKELILRNDDVQVLHGFESVAQANAYLGTELFSKDVVGELGPLLAAEPEVRIYSVFKK